MKKKYCLLLVLCISTILYSQEDAHFKFIAKALKESSLLVTHADSVITRANNLVESDYTIPTWTLLKRALTSAVATPDSINVSKLEVAMSFLKPKTAPYNVSMTLNGDPTSSMGFAWYTNQGISQGKVQLVLGKDATNTSFLTPDFSFDADTTNFTTNYCVSANGLLTAAGFADNSQRSYSSHKALVIGLQSNTTYSFRVGADSVWSDIGYFTTAKSGKDAFSFIYFNDSEGSNDSTFEATKKTLSAAKSMYPNANFALTCGNLVSSSGLANSEWEYEQFFVSQQNIWNTTPLAPIIGSHDMSVNQNFTRHFNTNVSPFDKNMATVPGSVYSFVYGDALFLALNYEHYGYTAYMDSLRKWVIQQVDANPTVKWKIAFFNKTMYTGGEHQPEPDITKVRNYFSPVFDSLKIDLALQGHDAVYEIIGPVLNNQIVPNSISNQTISTPNTWSNLNGKAGGTFDVRQGTMYFLNNSSGAKRYAPLSESTMIANEPATGISNYFGLFTGRFGQPDRPMFSYISISTDSINVLTYSVNSLGVAFLFDNFKVIKTTDIGTSNKNVLIDRDKITIYPNPVNTEININSIKAIERMDLYDLSGMKISSVENVTSMNVASIQNGVYILKIKQDDKQLVSKVVIQK